MTQPVNPQQNPFSQPEPGPVPGQPTPPAPQPAVASFIPPTVAAAVANPRARKGTSAGTMAFVAAVVIAAAGLGFAGGRLTAPASTTNGRGAAGNGGFAGNFGNRSFNPDASGNPNRGLGGFFGGAGASIDGQVTAISNGSITIQTSSGQSLTLQVPSTVAYHTQAAGSSSDVAVGSKVQLSVGRGGPGASGLPAASGQPGNGGFQMDVTDITVLGQ